MDLDPTLRIWIGFGSEHLDSNPNLIILLGSDSNLIGLKNLNSDLKIRGRSKTIPIRFKTSDHPSKQSATLYWVVLSYALLFQTLLFASLLILRNVWQPWMLLSYLCNVVNDLAIKG